MEASGKRWIEYGSRTDEFRLWNICDIHWGARACAERHLRETVQTIADDPFSFWFSSGDYGDFIGRSDKRFCPSGPAEWLKIADLGNIGKVIADSLLKELMPIKDKCLGFGYGNHDLKFMESSDNTDIHGYLCTMLGVPSLAYSGFFDLVFCRLGRIRKPRLHWTQPAAGSTRRAVRVCYHHGAGYAITPGGKLNRLLQFMRQNEADVYMTGHVHSKIFHDDTILAADESCGRLVERVRWGAVSGAYLKAYDQGHTTYAEIKMYQPTTLGAAAVSICPNTGAIKPYH